MFARILLIFVLVSATYNVCAASLSNEKRALIDQMLEFNGTNSLIPLMTQKLTHQIIVASSKNKDGKVDQQLGAIIQHEVKTAIYEEFVLSNKFNDIFYALYDEYFTLQQMKEMVQFYESKTGRAFLKNMPNISARSMEKSKIIAKLVGQKVQDRLLDKFDKAAQQIEDKAP